MRKLHFFLPGMFTLYGKTGRYPAVSITGSKCDLMCDHCMAHLLVTMPDCSTPQKLLEYALESDAKGDVGLLVSGGSDHEGRLPWEGFADTLAKIKSQTKLHLSVHTGFATHSQAKLLKDSGVDQALIDIIGSDEVARKIYHINLDIVKNSLDAVFSAGLNVVPHVLVGLDYGFESGEEHALEMISHYNTKTLVVIALRPSKQTKMGTIVPPTPERIADIIKLAKQLMPGTFVNLGCARPVGTHKQKTDRLAIDAGVDGLAVPSQDATDYAKSLGIEVFEHPTCCSMILYEAVPPSRLRR
jgi:uncharacterized radical SAM superfamily protein